MGVSLPVSGSSFSGLFTEMVAFPWWSLLRRQARLSSWFSVNCSISLRSFLTFFSRPIFWPVATFPFSVSSSSSSLRDIPSSIFWAVTTFTILIFSSSTSLREFTFSVFRSSSSLRAIRSYIFEVASDLSSLRIAKDLTFSSSRLATLCLRALLLFRIFLFSTSLSSSKFLGSEAAVSFFPGLSVWGNFPAFSFILLSSFSASSSLLMVSVSRTCLWWASCLAISSKVSSSAAAFKAFSWSLVTWWRAVLVCCCESSAACRVSPTSVLAASSMSLHHLSFSFFSKSLSVSASASWQASFANFFSCKRRFCSAKADSDLRIW